MQCEANENVLMPNLSTAGGQPSKVEWSPRWEAIFSEWTALQSKLESGSESILGPRTQTYRHIPDYDPPELPAWLVHLPEADGTTIPMLVFANTPPSPGEKLALRCLWEPEYVVLTALVMAPVRRIPRGVVEQAWMGAAVLDCLFVDVQ